MRRDRSAAPDVGNAREVLDTDELSATEADAALADLARVHRQMFGLHAVWKAVRGRLHNGSRGLWMIDVGSGSGELPEALMRRARRHGDRLRAIATDRKLRHLLRGRRLGLSPARVVADAAALPFRNGAVDLALSNLLFHHFDGSTNLQVIAEMRRVTRSGAIIVDLRPSRFAEVLFRLAARALRFSPVAYADGCTSLRRAWAVREVKDLTGNLPVVELRRRAPFRWTMIVESREE